MRMRSRLRSRLRRRRPRRTRLRHMVEQAKAQLEQAKLNLGYTKDSCTGSGNHHPQKRRDQPERQRGSEPDDAGFA